MGAREYLVLKISENDYLFEMSECSVAFNFGEICV